MDRVQGRESPPAKDLRPNHWATPPTKQPEQPMLLNLQTDNGL